MIVADAKIALRDSDAPGSPSCSVPLVLERCDGSVKPRKAPPKPPTRTVILCLHRGPYPRTLSSLLWPEAGLGRFGIGRPVVP
jgi:hypothetical protein